MAEPLLALNEARAGYGDAVVLDGIWKCRKGCLAVLGRNGVGKSPSSPSWGFAHVSGARFMRRARITSRAAPSPRARSGAADGSRRSANFPQ